MQILLLFLLIYFLITIRSTDTSLGTEKFISAVLLTSALIIFISESLSLFDLFSGTSINIVWTTILLFFIVLIVIKYKHYEWESLFTHTYKISLSKVKESKFLYSAIGVIILVLLFQSLVYPTNNYDSMVYHMPRIIHWIQNGSLAHYPTHIDRQLYQPPFSELVVGNELLLNRSDFFSNIIQLFYLVATMVLVCQIAKMAGFNKRYQLYTIIVALTVPSVLLEATTTKNDIVVSFFLIASFYYIWKFKSDKSWNNVLMIGISTGMAVFTKGTAYIFIAPILLLLAYYFLQGIKSGTGKLILKSGSLLAFFLLVNSGHYYRNYTLTGNILGTTESMKYQYRNEDFALNGITSNIIRNASLHLYLGETKLHDFTQKGVVKLHQTLGIDSDDPRYTYTKKYALGSKLAMEDTVPNFFHFISFMASFFLFFIYVITGKKDKIHKEIWLISGIVIAQIVLFCLYLKWQPWHTRLHIPVFFLMAPLVVFGLKIMHERILKIALGTMLIWAFVMVFFNFRRPLVHYNNLTSKISLNSPRIQKYSPGSLNRYKDILAIKHELETYEGVVGMITKGNAYTYPFMADLAKLTSIRFEDVNLQVNNNSRQIKRQFPIPEYIITDNIKLEKAGYRNILYERVYKGTHFSLLERNINHTPKKQKN